MAENKRLLCFLFRDKSAWYSFCNFVLGHLCLVHEINAISAVFLLVFTRGLSTSFMENLFANLSLTRNRKFDLISQSGWIVAELLVRAKRASGAP